MDAVLLDTDVFSYLLRGDPRSDPYKPHVEGKTIAIAFVTVGELYAGALKRKWGREQIERFETRLKAAVIVPYDIEVCRKYAELVNLKTESGSARTIPANDRWIAACALRHSLPLVTNNRKHFKGIPGLRLISEAPITPVQRTPLLDLEGPATRR